MIFEKPSTRTRVSFEVGMVQLGGHAVHLPAGESQLGRGEPIADTGAVLSRYLDAIVIRTHAHARVEELAAAASVPVINGLTDEHHPCQALADLQVLRERLGGLAGRRLAWVGDGSSNVCHSLAPRPLLRRGCRSSSPRPTGYEPFADELGAAAAVNRGRRRPGRRGDRRRRGRDRHVHQHGPGGRARRPPGRARAVPGERAAAAACGSGACRAALPAGALRRGDHAATCSGGRARPCGTRRRTGCTPRRRCWP